MENESGKIFSQQITFSLLFALIGFIIILILKLNSINLVFAFVFFGSFVSVIYAGKALIVLGFDFDKKSFKVITGFWAKLVSLFYLIVGILIFLKRI